MQTLRFEAENGRLYHQIESSEIFSNEELVKQGFTKKLNYPFNEILWEKATHGEALELRNTAVKYWKNKLYAVFRKLALKGESKYMVYLNKEFLQDFEEDGFDITFDDKNITEFSWEFSIEKLANELRKLSEREGVDRFLCLVKLQLATYDMYMKKMKLTPKQIDILKTENINVEVDGDYVKFTRRANLEEKGL